MVWTGKGHGRSLARRAEHSTELCGEVEKRQESVYLKTALGYHGVPHTCNPCTERSGSWREDCSEFWASLGYSDPLTVTPEQGS